METNSSKVFFDNTIKGGISYGLGSVFTRIITAINVLIILNTLSLYQYGVYKLVLSVYAIFGAIVVSGVDSIVLNDISVLIGKRNLAKAKKIFKEFVFIKLGLGTLSWAVFFLGASIIETYYSPGIADFLRILSILFITDSFISIFDLTFKATFKFVYSAMIPFFTEIIRTGILIYLVFFLGELNIYLMIWMLVGSSITVVILMLMISIILYGKIYKNISNQYSGQNVLWENVRTYGKWTILKSYFVKLPTNLRLWLVRIFISTEAVAIFSVAETFYSMIVKLIPMNMFSSLVPRQISDINRYANIYKKVTKYFMFFYFSLFVLSFIFLPLIIKTFFPLYIASIPIVLIILLQLLFKFFTLTKQTLFSLNRQKFLFIFPFMSLALVLILDLVLLPLIGLYGVAIEHVVTSTMLSVIMYLYLIYRYPVFKISIKDLFCFDSNDKRNIKYLLSKFKITK